MVKNADYLDVFEGLKSLTKIEFMTCLKAKWREKLFKILPNLICINNIDREGKFNESFEEEKENIPDEEEEEEGKLLLSYNIFY